MRNPLKRRRAVSPVFTTVMMIMVVVLGMSVVLTYFFSYVRDFQLGRGSAIMELIEIEDVWFQNEHLIQITVYNYGSADVTFTSLYVDKQLVDFRPNPIVVPRRGMRPESGLSVLWAEPTFSLEHEHVHEAPYHIRLVSERGSVFDGEYSWPVIP